MKTIWKFKLGSYTTINLPEGAQILHVREQQQGGMAQSEEVCLWAMVDPSRRTVERRFIVVGTGRWLDEKLTYIGTATLNGGSFVMHVFELNAP